MLMKHKVSGTRFATSRNHSNPNGLLDFLGTENDVSKTLAIISVFEEKSMKIVSQASDFAMKTQGFRNAICDIENHSNPNGLLDFLRTENDVSKTLAIISVF